MSSARTASLTIVLSVSRGSAVRAATRKNSAALSEAEFFRVAARTALPRLTDNTIVSEAVLADDMAHIRQRGYALDNEEHAVGLRCVAATIHDQHAEAVAALSLSGPRARITDDRLDILGSLVVRTADAVTAALGGTLPRWRER